MHTTTVFNQLFGLIRNHLSPFVGQLDKFSRKMNSSTLAKILLYAQITGKDSLRDIETGLQANESKLYHLGIKSCARSTISYRNNKVDSEVFEQLFYAMFQHYKQSCLTLPTGLGINTIAMDSSLVSLALGLYDRAHHRTTKGGIRLHVGIELTNCLPRFVVIKDAKKGDNIVAHQIIDEERLLKGEMIVFDRYYVDFSLRKKIDNQGSFFVTRTKENTDYTVFEEHNPLDPGIIQDATVELTGVKGVKDYDKLLRVVKFYDKESDRVFTYITNNFELSAAQIALVYKYRRKIEEFFRWIKQNLKIKSFLGTSENAVKNQIWIAMVYYLILQYLSSIAKLGKRQVLKMARLLREKCMSHFAISEIHALCRSKTSMCMTNAAGPPGSLFN